MSSRRLFGAVRIATRSIRKPAWPPATVEPVRTSPKIRRRIEPMVSYGLHFVVEHVPVAIEIGNRRRLATQILLTYSGLDMRSFKHRVKRLLASLIDHFRVALKPRGLLKLRLTFPRPYGTRAASARLVRHAFDTRVGYDDSRSRPSRRGSAQVVERRLAPDRHSPLDRRRRHPDPNPALLLRESGSAPALGFLVFTRLGVTTTGYHDDDEDQRAITVFPLGKWDEMLKKRGTVPDLSRYKQKP